MLIVQCDFDDTITVGNVSLAVREAFATGDWTEVEKEYHAGRCSVEESNIRQFALVRAARVDIDEFVLSNVVIRYAFEEFVEACRGEGIRLVIVSSGLDLYIEPTLRQLGISHLEVHSAKAKVSPDGVKVEYIDPSGATITRGFKESYLRRFKGEGNTVIYIGDGLSDITPASEADFVVARATLEAYFCDHGLPYYSFNTFADVGKHLAEIRRKLMG